MSDPVDAPREDEAVVQDGQDVRAREVQAQEVGDEASTAADAPSSEQPPGPTTPEPTSPGPTTPEPTTPEPTTPEPTTPEPTTPVTTAWDVAQDMASQDAGPQGAPSPGAAPDETPAPDAAAPAAASEGAPSQDPAPQDPAPQDPAPQDPAPQDPAPQDDAAPDGAAAPGAGEDAPGPGVAAEVAAPATEDGAAPRPAPRPGPGRPGPRPSAVRPVAPAAADPAVAPTLGGSSSDDQASSATGGAAGPGRPARSSGRPGGRRREERPSTPAVTAEHAPEDTAQWGRVDDDGVVHVRTADGERVVGSYPDVSADEALAYFGRRFADLLAQVDLVEQRLEVADAPVGELRSALAKVSRALADATAVGDLASLAERVDALGARVTEREREANIAREQARAVVRTERVQLVEEAEALAEADPAQVQWKASGERLRAVFEEWREQQRAAGTARLPKGEEDELWRRLKHARNRFERHRRHHFAELDARHGEAQAVKEGLIAEAEALSGSTEWGPTSTAYRQLMDSWKAAPRAARKEDDALWARFRAAQDVFFSARDAKDAEQLEDERANLVVKEALLAEAEAILPVRDVRAATAALRDVQDRWDAAGRVPRTDLGRVEKRMRAVEQAVRDADTERWRRTNPEARARAEGALGQLQDSIAGLEAELEHARTAGDERSVRRAQEALDARRAWLQQVERAAADFGG